MVPPWPAAATASSTLAAGVQMLRFTRAARLLAGIMCFRELVSQQLLIRLGLGRLLQVELLPFLRAAAVAGSGALGAAVARAEMVVLGLPLEWFQQGGAPAEAAGLVDLLAGLARALESGRGEADGVDRGALARRLAPLLLHIGSTDKAQRLAAAWGFQLQGSG